jgi:hypothetical protein
VVINAASFDTGGQGVAFNDTSAQDEGGSQGRNEGVDVIGNNSAVGWIDGGEWIEYTVNVTTAGAYTLLFNAASPEGGRTITASFAKNGTVYATAPSAQVVDTNNYTSFTNSQAVTVNLETGQQVIRLSFAGGAEDLFDFKSFSLQKAQTIASAQQFGAPEIVSILDVGDNGDMQGLPAWMLRDQYSAQPKFEGSLMRRIDDDLDFAGTRFRGEILDRLETLRDRGQDEGRSNQMVSFEPDRDPVDLGRAYEDDEGRFIELRRSDGDFLI